MDMADAERVQPPAGECFDDLFGCRTAQPRAFEKRKVKEGAIRAASSCFRCSITKVTNQVEVDKRHWSNSSHKPQRDICESEQADQYEQGGYDSSQYLAWRHMSQLCAKQ